MLSELRIQNMATIEDMTLSFESDRIALSGETGSGKSLIVNSLLLLTGERADFSLLRDKEKKGIITGVFTLDKDFLNRHQEIKEYVCDNTLILKRVLNPDKTSRFYLNGEANVSSSVRQVMAHILNIHSQNSNLEILKEENQLAYVDLFHKDEIIPAREEFETKYDEYLSKEKELDELVSSSKDIDLDYLNFQIKEIEKYSLKENEIENLNEEYLSLRQYEKVKEVFDQVNQALEGENFSLKDSLSFLYGKVRNFSSTPLEEKADEVKEKINELLDSINELQESYLDLKIDPKRMDAINERLFALKDLQRKYGKTTKEILDKYHSFKEKLSFASDFDTKKKEKEKEILKAKEEAMNLAFKLSSLRKESASELEKKIGLEMSSLGLRKNGLEIQIEEVPLNPLGMDKAVFYVSLNEGLERNTLAKAASGGETSRLLLALKIALNRLDPYSTLVLDEIDNGISGKSASSVSKKLTELSKESQILLISHLPQVVIGCSQCIEIKKEVIEDKTYTKAKALNKEEFLHLVARMISGDNESQEAYKQAKKLYEEYHG